MEERAHIKSYVRRTGNVTSAQEKAYGRLGPLFIIPYAPAPWNFSEAFGREAPLVMEIGFGSGSALSCSAALDSASNYLGVEVYKAGIGRLLLDVEEKELSNIRVIERDAVDVLTDMVADAELAGLRLFFPDPWPKTRHHKRRIVRPEFLKLLRVKLRVGGYFHMATDWEPYALAVVELIDSLPELGFVRGALPVPRPKTRFEEKGERKNYVINDLYYVKESDHV